MLYTHTHSMYNYKYCKQCNMIHNLALPGDVFPNLTVGLFQKSCFPFIPTCTALDRRWGSQSPWLYPWCCIWNLRMLHGVHGAQRASRLHGYPGPSSITAFPQHLLWIDIIEGDLLRVFRCGPCAATVPENPPGLCGHCGIDHISGGRRRGWKWMNMKDQKFDRERKRPPMAGMLAGNKKRRKQKWLPGFSSSYIDLLSKLSNLWWLGGPDLLGLRANTTRIEDFDL